MTTGQLTSLRPISTPQRNSHRPTPTCQSLTPPCNSLPTCQLDTFRPHATCQPDAISAPLNPTCLLRPRPSRPDFSPRTVSTPYRLASPFLVLSYPTRHLASARPDSSAQLYSLHSD